MSEHENAPAAPPEGEADAILRRKDVRQPCAGKRGDGPWVLAEPAIYLTVRERDTVLAALASATARAERAERDAKESGAYADSVRKDRDNWEAKAQHRALVNGDLTQKLAAAQAEAERLRGEKQAAIKAIQQEREAWAANLADADRRVEAMREAVLREARAAVIAERDAAERPDGLWIAGTAAGVHAIDKLIEALPATPAPETEQRCLGCGMYGGAHRDCPAPRLVDVHEWDRIRGADTTPAPGPSEEAEDIRAQCLLPVISAKHEAEAKGFEADAAYLDAIIRQIRAIPLGDVQPGPSAEDAPDEMEPEEYAAYIQRTARAPGGQDVR